MTPWVARLLWANIVMFLLQQLVPEVGYWLTLVPGAVLVRPWTLVSYMFLHGGLGHLFFNMLALYFFGPRLEERLGSHSFLWLYFISGLAGAALSLFLTPNPIIGASAGIFGVMLGFAFFWPRERIYIWGVLPIEARWLVIITTVIAIYSGITSSRSGIAHFAHLGGYLGALVYLKWLQLRSPARQFQRRAATPASAAAPTVREKDAMQRWTSIRREDLHEVNRAEIDRILDKISAMGIGSLTAGEREVLDRFSRKA